MEIHPKENFACQLYELTNLSLVHVQHLDHSCVHLLYFMFNIWITVVSTFFISCSISGSELCPSGRQEIFHGTGYDFINPSLFDVHHVEHSDVQYQGRALSVSQS